MAVQPVAFFKIRPQRTLPSRPGAVQCVRTCTSCIIRQDDHLDAEEEIIISMLSYDNLSLRRSMWFSRYASVIYHLGQAAILRNYLERDKSSRTLYILGCTSFEDIQYFQTVLKNENIKINSKIIDATSCEKFVSPKDETFIIPIDLPSCPRGKKTDVNKLLDEEGLHDRMNLYLNALKSGDAEDITIVQAIISKDHDRDSPFSLKRFGSLCIQILEPYSLKEYISHLHFEDPINHLAQHIYYDLHRHSARLASHLVAFILLYIQRDEEGVSHEDLVDYISWMRSNSLEFDLQIAFSGDPDLIVQSAISTLRDYIHIDSRCKIYRPIEWQPLFEFANTVAPNFACLGIICRAILTVHNSDSTNEFRLYFDPNVRVRVIKDDVLDQSIKLAQKLDKKVPFCRPCTTIPNYIIETFDKMQTFGKYFKIQEPLVRKSIGKPWAGDYDSDEEYYWSKKDDPAFKTWLSLTQRPYRLDRLNLFMNSLDAYLS